MAPKFKVTLASVPYTSVPDTCVVDLSWLMYRSRYAMINLSAPGPDGSPIPTGHLHGTILTVAQLSAVFPRVLLAVDSPSPRFAKFPEYKANRAEKKKNEFPIKTHTSLIVQTLSLLKNVFYIKHNGYEADDLISSIVSWGDNPVIFGTDNDLMQIPKPFRMANQVSGGEVSYVDLPKYIEEKYNIKGLDHLPVWYKVVRGDSSDNISSAVPRYSSKLLTLLCNTLEDRMDFDSLLAYIKETKDPKLNDHIEDLRRNWDVISPILYDREAHGPLLLQKCLTPVFDRLISLQLVEVLQMLSNYYGVAVL